MANARMARAPPTRTRRGVNDEEKDSDRAEVGMETGWIMECHRYHSGVTGVSGRSGEHLARVDLTTTGECHLALADHKAGCCYQGATGSA